MCSKSCGGGTQTMTYHIHVPAKDGGRPCKLKNAATKTITCHKQKCSADDQPNLRSAAHAIRKTGPHSAGYSTCRPCVTIHTHKCNEDQQKCRYQCLRSSPEDCRSCMDHCVQGQCESACAGKKLRLFEHLPFYRVRGRWVPEPQAQLAKLEEQLKLSNLAELMHDEHGRV